MDQQTSCGHGLTPRQSLALALPTFVFAGYDLARRSFLPMFLSDQFGLPIEAVGWLVALAGFAAIPAELLTGSVGDHGLAGWGRRGQWMVLGTLLIALGGSGLLFSGRGVGAAGATWPVARSIVMLVVGWALCNVTHGAWALEAAADAAARARVFGLRSMFGIVGGMVFAALAVLPGAVIGPPFAGIMAVVVSGAVLTHGLLVAQVPDRPAAPARWRPAQLLDPLRLLWLNAGNRRLAALFALNGAHTALTTTGYLYLAEFGLGLPAWGPTGVFLQAACATAGIAVALRAGTRLGPERLLCTVLWANLLLALLLPLLPPHQPFWLLAWSAAFGLFSAVDFMALRVLLGNRLDYHRDATSDPARAASYYAGFHLPFNLCAAAASGLLFAGYRLLGFDPGIPQSIEHVFYPVVLAPAVTSLVLMGASIYLVEQYRRGPIQRPGLSLRNSTTSPPSTEQL